MSEGKGLVIRASHRTREKPETIYLTINLAERKSGHIFVPLNEEQRAAAERFYATELPGNIKFGIEGISTIKIIHDKRKVLWTHFYPFGVSKDPVAPPKKMGIGSLVHHAIIEYLATRHNLQDYEVSHDPEATDERIRQLRLMGIDHRKAYSFPEYREIVRQAIVKRFGAEPKLEIP